jgi:hypothetical protein
MTVPVAIFNIVNFKVLETISATKFTFTFLIALSLVGLGALTKTKKRSYVWTLVIGVMLTILGEAATQIGYSLLIIGGCMLVDNFIITPIAKIYKVRWYNELGRTITYTQSID